MARSLSSLFSAAYKAVVIIVLAALILLAGMIFFPPPVAAAELTPAQAAKLLEPSVFAFGTTHQQSFCTATKIGPREYLTALHCAIGMDTNYRLESKAGEYVFIRSVLGSVATKETDRRREDWAILIASADGRAPSLPLGCGDPHHVGEPVAYMGFPESLTWAFGAGYISTLDRGKRNSTDFFIDVPGAPGASGAAIISLDSGHIIGVLTQGVRMSRTGQFYMVGVESVEQLDICEDWDRTLKYWDDIGDQPSDLHMDDDDDAAPAPRDVGHT